MTIGEWTHRVYTLAKEKGWWEDKQKAALNPREAAGLHMLMVSEIAEATECLRKDEPPVWQEGVEHGKPVTPEGNWSLDKKPEGELIELADCVIRIMDYCGHHGWDLENAINIKHTYNVRRAYKHGGKKF